MTTMDPLKAHRGMVAAAETALMRARSNMRAAAEREGLNTAGLFGDTKFVARTTAARWVRDARHSARAEMVGAITVAKAASDAANASSARSAPSSGGRPVATAELIIAAGKKARGEKD